MITKKVTILALLALLATTGCTQAPNMVDYSYVPTSHTITVETAPGIEAF